MVVMDLLSMAQVVVVLMVVGEEQDEIMHQQLVALGLQVKAMLVEIIQHSMAERAGAVLAVQDIRLPAQKIILHPVETVVLAPLLTQLCWALLDKEYWLAVLITLAEVGEAGVIKPFVNPLVDQVEVALGERRPEPQHLQYLILVAEVVLVDLLVGPMLVVQV
jgi:hypothetical protein